MNREDIIRMAREAGVDWTGQLAEAVLVHAMQHAYTAGAAAEREAFPRLQYVIDWLENGCDPKEAAKELRLHDAAIRARGQA